MIAVVLVAVVRGTGAIPDTYAFTDAPSAPTVINSTVSSGAALTNLGSNFLERLGNQSSNGFNLACSGPIPAAAVPRRARKRRVIPNLVRRLRELHEDRRDRRFRRR